MKVPLLCATLMLATMAGCVQDAAPPTTSPPLPSSWGVPPLEVFTDAELLDLAFTAADGTTMHGTAYLPKSPREGAKMEDATQADGTQPRFGTIVNLSPYYGNAYGVGTDGRLNAVRDGTRAFNQTLVGMLVAHGFAYVAASVPGTGKSGGCFGLGGLHEQKTMAEFIDWVGEQPWSNGNVGMVGGSYDGTTQWMAAIHAPKHLRTIVPQVSITDFYEYEYQDGAPYAWWGPYFLPHYLLLVGWGLDPTAVDPSDPLGYPDQQQLEPGLLQEDLCPGAADHFTEAEKAYATGVYSTWWQERNYLAGFANLNASVFLVHGLQDWNVKPLHLDVWDAIPTEKIFWLQQMQHNAPWRDTYNKEWSRPDYNATLLAWYDHYLNGVENGVPQLLPAVTTQDQTGMWRNEERWPPASVQDTTFFLGAKSLDTSRPGAGQTIFTTPPSYAGALVEPSTGVRGPTAPDEVVAKFYTEPLAEPMRIAGVPELLLNVSVDRPGYSHIVAQLYVQHEDGKWEWLDMGARGLAQREGREQDDQVTPAQVLAVPIVLNPTESFLDTGDRLVLLLSGDDPDWFHPNGNTPTFILEHGSTLTLPLLPADAPRGMEPGDVERKNVFYRADEKQF